MVSASGAEVRRGGRAYRLVRPARVERRAVPLDAVQRAVVEHENGPLLVLGGPGTGKTTIVASALIRAIEHGVSPDRLLAFTFSRKAALRLREDVVAQLGQATFEPAIRTFHGYAFGLLRQVAARRGQPAPRLLSGPEQDVVIRDLLAGDVAGIGVQWPERLLPALRTRGFAAELRDLLLRCYERGVDPVTLARWGSKHGRDDWVAAARFMQQYADVTELRDASMANTRAAGAAYDPAELIRAAVCVLDDDPELLAEQRQQFPQVFVDEYHDVDPAQRELLQLLCGGGRFLVAFADPDQAIFEFRGSEPGQVREFGEQFRTMRGESAPTITLHTCYRSPEQLVSATRRIAQRLRGPASHRRLEAAPSNNKPALVGDEAFPGSGELVEDTTLSEGPLGRPVENEKPARSDTPLGNRAPADNIGSPGGGALVENEESARNGVSASDVTLAGNASSASSAAPSGSDNEPSVHVFRSASQESAFIAHQLRHEHVRHGVAWSRMAVIVRSGVRNIAGVRRALAQCGVPVRLDAEHVALAEQPAVAALLLLVKCALRPDTLDEDAAVALLSSPLAGVDALTMRKLRSQLRRLAIASGSDASSMAMLVEVLRDPADLVSIESPWVAPVRRVANLLRVAQQAPPTPEQVLWAVWDASGVAQQWQHRSSLGGQRGAAADRDLDAVIGLFEAAATFSARMPGAGPLVFVDHVYHQRLPADSLASTANIGEAVTVLSAHAAKGRQWDVVCVAGVTEGAWPDLRLRGSLLGSQDVADLAAGREVGPHATAGAVERLLDEERRLFYVAATRARHTLIATAVDGDDCVPSRFVDELSPPDVDQPREITKVPRPITLSGLVAELRVTVAKPASAHRDVAAALLAALAARRAPGADPDQWWGAVELSDDAPLAGVDERVRVSPSGLEKFVTCELRWLLDKCGGAGASSVGQELGNAVHEVAAFAARRVEEGSPASRAELVEQLERELAGVDLGSGWFARRSRERANTMVHKLADWLDDNTRRLIAAERDFSADVGDRVLLRGRADRVEADEHDRLVVVDFKTGKSQPSKADAAKHPQLAAYQEAVRAGAFDEGDSPGGAVLVQLGTNTKGVGQQWQEPPEHTPDPHWARDLVQQAGEGMGGAEFTARANQYCEVCAVRTSCPLSTEHVT